MGQLAKQLAEKSSSSFGANTEKNPKKKCKGVMTRSRKLVAAKDEDIVALKEQVVLKDTTDKENDEVKDERSQWREKQIIVGKKEIKDNEKEIKGEKQKEKEEFEKYKEEKKSKSEKAREKRKETTSDEGKEMPYPLVPVTTYPSVGGRRVTRGMRLPRKEYARSRHQRLFEENVRKTGKDVVYEL